jgi:lipopolysaccharide transport system ATP-binding protein
MTKSDEANLGPVIISASQLCKTYKMYPTSLSRFKEVFSPSRKKYHSEFRALRDINFAIRKGECVGIIGLNGSGKSTLLQLIAGVLTPSSGQVTSNGRIAALLELGAGFNGDFTGRENVYFQCAIMGFSKKQANQMVPDIESFAGIGEFFDQPVRTYSSGMYVRLAFAAAIIAEPDILIIDEALAVGDVQFQAKCYSRIQEYKDSGKTMLFVSHDPAAVKGLCSRAFLINQGSLISEGTPNHVYNVYNALIAEKNDGNPKDNSSNMLDAALQQKIAKRSGSGEVRVTNIRLKNYAGDTSDSFVSGTQFSIELEFESQIDVINPTFGILIRDRFGSDMFGVNSHILRKNLGQIKAGSKGVIHYSMTLNLGPGLYQLSTAIHHNSSHVESNYDWINDAVSFRVVTEGDYPFVGCARMVPELNCQIASHT